jgi:FtsK/SpoIIIE family
MVSFNSTLTYWYESAPAKGQSQGVDCYPYVALNIFKLISVPDFSSEQMKALAQKRGKPTGIAFAVDLQKQLLQGLAYFSSSQSQEGRPSTSCGYSLRILCQAGSNKESNSEIEIFLIARVASSSSSTTDVMRTEQRAFLESLLQSQSHIFELSDEESSRHLPQWLQGKSLLSCYEILKPEEFFPWVGSEGKYFYSPGSFQVKADNTMISLFEQIALYASRNQELCLDITLVPTKISDYEKHNISRYLDALQQAAKGVKEENILPDANAIKAKSIYELIQQKNYSSSGFLYSFRVITPKNSASQSLASQLAACCVKLTSAVQIIEVEDSEYVAKTLKEININDRVANQTIWSNKTHPDPSLFIGPVTLKRLHRIVDLEDASAFFRLPISIGGSYPCVPMENQRSQQVSLGDMEVEEIIRQHGDLITEDTYIVGLDQYGKPYTSSFSKIPHRLIAGTTGAGKTNFILWVIYQFLYASHKIGVQRNVYIADFKSGFDFHRLAKRFDTIKLVTKAEDLALLLADVWNEYERRLEVMIESDSESLKELRENMNSDDHRIIIIIDEAASILNAERKQREEISKYLQELSAKSRITGIHIFYCSQRPTPDVIPRLISDNMDERVVFRVFPAASQLLLDDDLASTLPSDPKGRAVYRGLEPDLKVLATPYFPKKLWDNNFEI